MRRSEISDDGEMWTIPGSRTKNHRPCVVPMTPLAKNLVVRGSADLVFTTNGTTPLSGWSRMKRRLDAAVGDGWVLHDLRRTAATGMAEIGIAPHIIEAVLNHISGARAGVAGIYNRANYLPEKKAALARWAAHVDGLYLWQDRQDRRSSRQEEVVKPPRWSDEVKVAELVGKIIEDQNAEAEMLDAFEEATREYPPMWMSEVLSSMEREAIEATEDGNLELLADMIENPMFNGKLSPKAWSIIAANLRGKFKSRRGPKRRPNSELEARSDPSVRGRSRDQPDHCHPEGALSQGEGPPGAGHRHRRRAGRDQSPRTRQPPQVASPLIYLFGEIGRWKPGSERSRP